ncbi:unnamed protein product [Mytilus coruscus]|uniref:Uncharacterized protein n=1 Tax=Mytilus coruscus TaxID=42192 RepID=A0A6J8B6H7_MYTCO|nr:unnamed protein product [Mytilus coruscus]
MNEPVLRYLLSLYSEIPFDVNLFLRKIYCQSWLKELNCLSHKPLKWIVERFEDQKIAETDFLLRSTCQFQMFDTVVYLVSKCKTFDAISCIKMYLNKDGKNDDTECISNFYFNEDLFNFLFSKIDIDKTSSEMIAIVMSTLQKPCVPDSVCETLLPKVLILACEDGRIDVAKWILHSFEQTSLDIEDRDLFMLACDDGRHQAFVQTLLDIANGDLVMLACNKVSHFKYQARKIDMVRWVVETFQIKPLDIKLGVLTLIRHKKYNKLEIGDAFFKLGVFLLNKHFNCLSTEDKEELMNSFLQQKHYDVVNWLMEDKGFVAFDKQQVLNEACSDGQIKTIQMLKDYFHSLDMNEALMYACIGYNCDQTAICEYLLSEIDKPSLDISKIHILLTVENEKLDTLSAFRAACLQPNERTVNFKDKLCIVDILFQKLQDKASNVTEVLNGLLENKRYALILYFLEQGHYTGLNMKNLMNEVCRHGHVKLVQWILENVKHEELDIKSAFLAACKNVDYELQLQCLALMWHFIQNKNLFELDSVLDTITEAPSDLTDKYDDLRNWLLYTKTINERMMSES